MIFNSDNEDCSSQFASLKGEPMNQMPREFSSNQIAAAKPCVLIFSPNKAWGGSEKFWFEPLLDANFTSNAVFNVTLASEVLSWERLRLLESNGITVDESWSRRLPSITRAVRKLERIFLHGNAHGEIVFWRKQLQRVAPQFVWFNLGTIGDACDIEHAAAACREVRIPYWIVIQFCAENYFPPEEDRGRLGALLSSARRVIFVSKRNRASVERAIGGRLENAWCTVNAVSPEFVTEGTLIAAKRHPQTSPEPVLLNLSRLVPVHKGQHILLEALAESRWAGRPWRLILQGDGNLREMERMRAYYGFDADRVAIKPGTHNIYDAFSSADLFVMTSLAEGMPYAMVEAMACGLPCLGTPVAGIPELIIEGKTGWLARSIEVSDVSDALERAWAERSRWSEYGASALKHVSENFNLGRNLPHLISALKNDLAIGNHGIDLCANRIPPVQ